MTMYTNPFEAMTVANSILVKKGLSIYEGDWAKEILEYRCNRRYQYGEIYYEVDIQLTSEGFNEARRTFGIVDYTICAYSIPNDPYVRIKITLEGVLSLRVLVPEEECDAIMAL